MTRIILSVLASDSDSCFNLSVFYSMGVYYVCIGIYPISYILVFGIYTICQYIILFS